MKYYEAIITITPCTQDAKDLLSALSAEAGFETFEETATGLKAYAQQALYDQAALDAVIASFPIAGTQISYQVDEAEDRDWNEQWEQEGFEPIIVTATKPDSQEDKCTAIVIHDGRHLPDLSLINPQTSQAISVEIDAHLAFGTGTHETTRMICATLLNTNLSGTNVLDCGCGTGILGICALKLGAAHCVGYDIDEWSADNTRHNAVINGVDDRLTVYCGDSTILDAIKERFQLVMANINRNILLNDMERFCSVMSPRATLILSGFYLADSNLIISKGQQLGLSPISTINNGEWACVIMKR